MTSQIQESSQKADQEQNPLEHQKLNLHQQWAGFDAEPTELHPTPYKSNGSNFWNLKTQLALSSKESML